MLAVSESEGEGPLRSQGGHTRHGAHGSVGRIQKRERGSGCKAAGCRGDNWEPPAATCGRAEATCGQGQGAGQHEGSA
eukprot:1608751-Rhodomonas_salina.4